MHLSKLVVENFRCFGEADDRLELLLKPGLTALVGENEAGKTALIDAIRIALGTSDQQWYRIEDSDFHQGSKEIRIVCQFSGLDDLDRRAFVEYLTYGTTTGSEPFLYVNWTAKETGQAQRGRPHYLVEIHSGRNGDGPIIDPLLRDMMLRVTYLRPLRDADQSLSSGRGSRLAQILNQSAGVVTSGKPYDSDHLLRDQSLSVLGIGDLLYELLSNHAGILDARKEIDKKLAELSLIGDGLKSDIRVTANSSSSASRLRELLEKLELRLDNVGKPGLGSNNLLFTACELLLTAEEKEGLKLLLIEEPEAHLHPQRQLRVMKYLQQQAVNQEIQIIVTTHSPNLASAIQLDNVVMIHKRQAFPLAVGQTKLEISDYRFLARFLDVTKANLFFARGVLIVEGDAENILLPTIARLIGLDLAEHGASIVNVGGVGLRRYARVFQRAEENGALLKIPVACLTDMDVMPDCAPTILGKVESGQPWPPTNKRRWRAKRDFGADQAIESRRQGISAKASGQSVKTFVADHWTFEYDLALGPAIGNTYPGGLAEYVFIAASLSEADDAINSSKSKVSAVILDAKREFERMRTEARPIEGCSVEEVLASFVYAKFGKEENSKPIAAQYLAQILESRVKKGRMTAQQLKQRLPKYIVEAISYVAAQQVQEIDSGETANGI
jgi:putative ATP-dependent endonuclease of the OLD family